MPLRSPIPSGYESLGTWVQYLESAIAADDAVNVNRYMIDLTNILGASYAAGLSEFDPVSQEVETILAAASRWLRDRVAAGPGGQSIEYSVTGPGDVSYEDATTEATTARPAFAPADVIQGLLASLSPSDIRPGEDMAAALRRLFLAEYDEEPPAALLDPYRGIMPFRSVTGPVSDGPPPTGGPDLVVDFDGGGGAGVGVEPGAPSNVGFLIAAGVVLLLLAKKR